MTEWIDSETELTAAIESLRVAARSVDPVDPFAGAAALARGWLGEEPQLPRLVEAWGQRSRGHLTGDMRYRWEISHRRGVQLPFFSPPAQRWRAWRSAEQPVLEKDPFVFEQRLSLPVALTQNCEVLSAAARDLPLAAELLQEAAPTMRRDFALCIQGL